MQKSVLTFETAVKK